MKKIIKLIVLSIFCVMLVACVSNKNDTSATIQDQQEETKVEIQLDEENMLIETMYGNIKYPYAFSDLIRVNRVENKGSVKITFSVTTDDFSAEIYEVSFGEGTGMKLGAINGTHVFVNIVELQQNITENEKNIFYAAQETVNDVIASIMQWENFTETK